ncbi:hypothetical protein Q5Y75_27470 [Ruegeria sp. 2205SS24-7]|uniref:hypothetical protein n=1 Tax=Ruegeria discodermiae TaxID=3064389 RepID=UPI0027407BBB|nr:hypothetical protein [Ruegeria sp. 2205SS24-7]MDP5220930.1 hypothetical protein [Ruegeria sp. 2205SS24-7]
MRDLRRWICVFCLALPIGATAQTDEALVGCGQTELLHSNTSIRFVGANPAKADVGDRRILHWYLEDLSGLYVGAFDVVTTVLGGSEDMGHYVRVDGSFTFLNGDIFVATTTSLANAAYTHSSGDAQQVIDWAVTGGTGDFANAGGIVSISVPEEHEPHLDNRPLSLDIRC